MKSMSLDSCIQSLRPLGFSELEATIYTHLCREPGVTAYKVAQELGKPVANTYKAITNLCQKGALMFEENDPPLYTAVAPEALMLSLRCQASRTFDAALTAFEHIGPVQPSGGSYRLSNKDQVVTKAREMIDGSSQVVLANLFPQPLALVMDCLISAVERGVMVVLKVYQPVEIPGANIVCSNEIEFLEANFPWQEMAVVVDASESLIAFLTRNGELSQAIWTNSNLLAVYQYSGLYSEWNVTRMRRNLDSREGDGADARPFEGPAPLMGTPGYKLLVGSRAEFSGVARK